MKIFYKLFFILFATVTLSGCSDDRKVTAYDIVHKDDIEGPEILVVGMTGCTWSLKELGEFSSESECQAFIADKKSRSSKGSVECRTSVMCY